MKLLALILACAALSACGPSCEAQGGVLVQDGFVYIWQITDYKTGMGFLMPYPNYVCVSPKANTP